MISQPPNPQSLKTLIREINKSLLNLSIALMAMESMLPILLDGYYLALQHKLMLRPPNHGRMKLLEFIVPELRQEVDALNALVLRLAEENEIK
jgi:hypothetical protein